jgi:hypothetical protein
MGQLQNLDTSGIETFNSPLISPPGKMADAKNMVCTRGGTIEARRGFSRYLTSTSTQIDNMFVYQDKVMVSYDDKMAYDNGTGFTDNGSHTSPTRRMKSVQANNNFYFTTDNGVYKLDAYNNSPVKSGIPKGLQARGTPITPTTGWFTNNTRVSYRVVWGKKDENGNLILGEPSPRMTETNITGGNQDALIEIFIPYGITTDHTYYLYRSPLSVDQNTEPNDEMQLITEGNPTTGQISTGVVSYSDRNADDIKREYIYTAPSQEGVLQGNTEPPLCQDMAEYKNHVFYANTKQKHSLMINMISDLANNDTITIDGVVFTGKTGSVNFSNGEFFIETARSTTAENFEKTLINLARTIRLYTSSTDMYAYYIGTPNNNPGKMQITKSDLNDSIFVVTSSAGTKFNPEIPSSGTTYASDNDERPNRVYYSKFLEPENAPILNYFDVGSRSEPIKRIIPLRNALMILKTDGVYALYGDTPDDFTLRPVDKTLSIKAPDTAAKLDNKIMFMSDHGIVAMDSTNSAIISKSINTDVLKFLNDDLYSSFEDESFGVAYESEHLYMMWTLKDEGDTAVEQAYVYNNLNNSWTRWEKGFSCGLLNTADNKLYFGDYSGQAYKEKKAKNETDYGDEAIAVTISSYTGTEITLADGTNAVVNQVIYQQPAVGNYIWSKITAVDGNDITVEDEKTWDLAAASLHVPYETRVDWIQQHCGSPGLMKQFQELTFLFREGVTNTVTCAFTSEVDPTEDTVDIAPKLPLATSLTDELSAERTYFPLEKGRAKWSNISIYAEAAFYQFSVAGVSIIYDVLDTRFV